MTAKHPSTFVPDSAGFLVLLFATLNLNGIFLLLLGTQGLLSPIILLLVLVLWIFYARPSLITGGYCLFVIFMGSYLGLASIINLGSSSFSETVFWINFATILLVSGLYFWLSNQTESQLETILRFFKTLLVISCIFVILSPILKNFFNYVAASDRASGLFENPNEAGVAALIGLVLIYAYPARRRMVTVLEAVIVLSALALTFSKTAIISLAILVTIILVQRRSIWLFCLAILSFGLVGLALSYISDTELVPLTRDQRMRIDDILGIFQGEVTEQTTTGRTELWTVGIERILAQLPWGGGIGSFHALEGTRRTVMYPDDSSRVIFGNWLGVHNSYLMVLGEAGFFPFVLLIAFLARLFLKALNADNSTVPLAFGVIICMAMMASHGALGFRLVNVALAFAMVIGERSLLITSNRPTLAAQGALSTPLNKASKMRLS